MKISENDVIVPADVPKAKRKDYIKNYLTITHNTGNIMLFAGDQKIEHLNDDFSGSIKVDGKQIDIPEDDSDPEHLFKIASTAKIGVFASQLGMIARYGPTYDKVPYLVKLNSKTHLVKTDQNDPISTDLVDVDQVVKVKEDSGLNILGIGYTVYIGSEYESDMLRGAAQAAFQAHQNGLLAVFWMYPRGSAVADEKDPHIIAGAAGVGACLGADFVKVNYPKASNSAESMKEAVQAAGRTKVITAGGSSKPVKDFLQETHDQLHISGCGGNATGRNIHQKTHEQAVALANAISSIIIDGKSVDEAFAVFEGKA